MTEKDVQDLLLEECEKAGSRRQWATMHGISASYVTDVLMYGKPPGPLILAALGIEKSYRKVTP